MDDPPDPSIEATRTESRNLSVCSHLDEGKPEWAFNCRWEDWAASAKENGSKEGHEDISAGKSRSASGGEQSASKKITVGSAGGGLDKVAN